MRLELGDCREVLKTLADASVDSVVCDPPYELGFMGKAWDDTGIAYDANVWRQVLRVLKPGGHLLAFGGSRTYHRLACAVEDAGFEIRDQIMWVYGSGFPKSLDVSKAIDKAAGEVREVIGINEDYLRRKPNGMQTPGAIVFGGYPGETDARITAPATDAARQWQGWGTALKPAHEPIVVARKPLIGTVADNVLAYGTGAINVDGCRVGTGEDKGIWPITERAPGVFNQGGLGHVETQTIVGRWPANLIHDGSAEVVARFPDARSSGNLNASQAQRGSLFLSGQGVAMPGINTYTDTGSAARFFYTAKADATDRDQGLEGFARQRKNADAETIFERVHSPDPNVIAAYLRHWRELRRLSKMDLDVKLGTVTLYSWFEGRPAGIHLPTPETWAKLKELLGFDDTHDAVMLETREVSLEERTERSAASDIAMTHRLSGLAAPRGNHHPTVKPTELMRYLCRLVTPPGGIVLDPFMGSGSTGKAAALERFDFIGIEQDPDYLEIARARIAWLGTEVSSPQPAPRYTEPARGVQLELRMSA